MLKIRYWIKDFFGFPRSQVNGFLVLFTLLILLLFSEPAWHWWTSNRHRDFDGDRATLDSLIALWDQMDTAAPTIATIPKTFYFDPNKSTEQEFVELGFSPALASRIIRYREKGGKFRTKSDVLKIYGIDTAFYKSIYSFIALPESTSKFSRKEKTFPVIGAAKEPEKRQRFDLNKADTAALKAIKGIGDKLSMRIVKFRDILGGFVSMDQLKDVYGLDSLVIKKLVEDTFIEDNFMPTRLDLNQATERELSAHPYINKMAKVIVSYRFQHGDFETVEDIRKVVKLDEERFQKILPYIEVKAKHD